MKILSTLLKVHQTLLKLWVGFVPDHVFVLYFWIIDGEMGAFVHQVLGHVDARRLPADRETYQEYILLGNKGDLLLHFDPVRFIHQGPKMELSLLGNNQL